MLNTDTFVVYGLKDPRDSSLRYIGITRKPLKVRLLGHYCNPTPTTAGWINDLSAIGLRPAIEALDSISGEKCRVGYFSPLKNKALRLEHAWITKELAAGSPLLNRDTADRSVTYPFAMPPAPPE